MSRKEIAKRYILFVISLFFAALGVAVTRRGGLGVSPISSVANVMSSTGSTISLGTWLIIWNCVLILGQLIIRGREFEPMQLLQIPLSFLFGWFTDFGTWLVGRIHLGSYFGQLAMVLLGIVILSFGVALAVVADVIMNSGEAFVKAVADKTHQNFGRVKVGFDVVCVLASVALSLMLFDGQIIGTREGTILTALLTGVIVNFFVSHLESPLGAVLSDRTACAHR